MPDEGNDDEIQKARFLAEADKRSYARIHAEELNLGKSKIDEVAAEAGREFNKAAANNSGYSSGSGGDGDGQGNAQAAQNVVKPKGPGLGR